MMVYVSMFTRTREESMRKFFVASTVLALGGAALMGLGLKAAADFNPMRPVAHSLAFTIQLPAKVLGGELAKSPVGPKSNAQAKADKLPILDSEAAEDVADVEEAMFKTRFAAVEQK